MAANPDDAKKWLEQIDNRQGVSFHDYYGNLPEILQITARLKSILKGINLDFHSSFENKEQESVFVDSVINGLDEIEKYTFEVFRPSEKAITQESLEHLDILTRQFIDSLEYIEDVVRSFNRNSESNLSKQVAPEVRAALKDSLHDGIEGGLINKIANCLKNDSILQFDSNYPGLKALDNFEADMAKYLEEQKTRNL